MTTETSQNLIDQLTPIFRDVFSQPDLMLTPDASSATIAGWDSFSHINLVLELETKFNVSFSTKELGEMSQVGDLVTLLEAKLAGK